MNELWTDLLCLSYESWAKLFLEARIMFELQKKQPRLVYSLGNESDGFKTALEQLCPETRYVVEDRHKQESIDVFLALEPEDLDGFMTSGLAHAKTRLCPWSILYLAVPIADYGGLSDAQVIKSLEAGGLTCWHRWNYAARPQIAKRLRMNGGPHMRGYGNPPSLVDAHALPIATYQKPVPGKVLYMAGLK